jgi:hypothetical protein
VDWDPTAETDIVSKGWQDLGRWGAFELGWSAWLCAVGWRRRGQPCEGLMDGGVQTGNGSVRTAGIRYAGIDGMTFWEINACYI